MIILLERETADKDRDRNQRQTTETKIEKERWLSGFVCAFHSAPQVRVPSTPSMNWNYKRTKTKQEVAVIGQFFLKKTTYFQFLFTKQ